MPGSASLAHRVHVNDHIGLGVARHDCAAQRCPDVVGLGQGQFTVQFDVQVDEDGGAGGSEEADVLYRRFRGRMPGVEALLKGRGLADAA